MKEKLKEFAKGVEIEKLAIADIGPYMDLKEILVNREEKDHLTGLEGSSIEKRIDPTLTMKDAKSIIVCLFPYKMKTKEKSNLSNYTYSKDYYVIVKEKLETIANFLDENIENFKYESYVDTGPLVDRYIAHRAGLGFYGINAHLINDDYGTYFFIGYIINNHPFKADKAMDRTCFECMKCKEKCPGNIILGNFDINPKRCRSYISQKKKDLDELDIDIIKKDNILFGCDICQKVCPHNGGIKETNIKEFKEDLIYKLEYEEINAMSNKAFKRKYGNRAFAWRGRKLIKRNHEIINDIEIED